MRTSKRSRHTEVCTPGIRIHFLILMSEALLLTSQHVKDLAVPDRHKATRQGAPLAGGASIAVENVGVGHYPHHILAPHGGAAPHCLLLKRC